MLIVPLLLLLAGRATLLHAQSQPSAEAQPPTPIERRSASPLPKAPPPAPTQAQLKAEVHGHVVATQETSRMCSGLHLAGYLLLIGVTLCGPFSRAISAQSVAAPPLFDGVRYHKVQVVAEADRNSARTCRVASVNAEVLRCRRFLRQARVFQRKEIISISAMPHCVSCTLSPLLLGASGVLIAGGFFAGPAAPAMWVLGGLAFSAAGAIAVGDSSGPPDVLYPRLQANESRNSTASAEPSPTL